MADAVSTKVIFNSPKYLVVSCTNLSDGTGESAVVKVDKSTYTGPNGLEPSKFAVESIDYDVSGMNVQVYFDRTTAGIIGQFQGFGHINYMGTGGGWIDLGTGNTGDILFTTTGATAADSYTIVLHLRKKD